MSIVPTILLKDGNRIPQLGFGLWRVSDAESQAAVETALRAGYRLLDSAQFYENEAGVGRGILASGVPRQDVFVTTKVWNTDQGFDQTLRAFELSLGNLGLDYLDLYLIHWPSPHRDLYVASWKALLRLRREGRVRSVGVSNFCVPHLERLIAETGEAPVINQIELHPRYPQRALRAFHSQFHIATQAWSPLGQGILLGDPVVLEIASKHRRSAAQVLLRWHLRQGLIAIPKSITADRIRENFDVFGFDIDDGDARRLDALATDNGRVGPDPATAAF